MLLIFLYLPGGTLSGFYTVEEEVQEMIYIDDILQVCDDSFVASCVGCCVSTVPALWCEEAIPRTSKLEKRLREGGRRRGREGREGEKEKDSAYSVRRSYSGLSSDRS